MADSNVASSPIHSPTSDDPDLKPGLTDTGHKSQVLGEKPTQALHTPFESTETETESQSTEFFKVKTPDTEGLRELDPDPPFFAEGEMSDISDEMEPFVSTFEEALTVLRQQNYDINKTGLNDVIMKLPGVKLYYAPLHDLKPEGNLTTRISDTGASETGLQDDKTVLRILEVGCNDGTWCKLMKEKHPAWIIEGVDTKNLWSAASSEKPLEAQLKGMGFPGKEKEGSQLGKGKDPIRGEDESLQGVDLSVYRWDVLMGRNLPVRTYDYVRGRDVIVGTRDYKNFLAKIYRAIKPGGFLELVELDPRPRTLDPSESELSNPTYDPKFPWMAKPRDETILSHSHPWVDRVRTRLEQLQPHYHDGEFAADLHHWMSAAAFYSVKQTIVRIPVGPWMKGDIMQGVGTAMLDLLMAEIHEENSLLGMPLKDRPGSVELGKEHLAGSGDKHYLNLHFVSGRKPLFPLYGELMPDGSRYGMKDNPWEAEARKQSAPGYKSTDTRAHHENEAIEKEELSKNRAKAKAEKYTWKNFESTEAPDVFTFKSSGF
ncbi:MAG: hypothetical protein M1819_005938 [Sarea resinae]|nr:MAG: hypothetical protein M1819_005938 [Sarea resinae]